MTYTLTLDQIKDFRVDLDLPAVGVFTDAELNRFYNRASGDYDKAKVYALRVLLMSSAKLHDYTAGQSSERLGQVYDHLKDMLKTFEATAGMGGASMSVGNIGLNIDSTSDNETEWDGVNDPY